MLALHFRASFRTLLLLFIFLLCVRLLSMCYQRLAFSIKYPRQPFILSGDCYHIIHDYLLRFALQYNGYHNHNNGLLDLFFFQHSRLSIPSPSNFTCLQINALKTLIRNAYSFLAFLASCPNFSTNLPVVFHTFIINGNVFSSTFASTPAVNSV